MANAVENAGGVFHARPKPKKNMSAPPGKKRPKPRFIGPPVSGPWPPSRRKGNKSKKR